MDIIDVFLKENKTPYGKPTDVIGFGSLGKGIANMLLPIVGQKEMFNHKVQQFYGNENELNIIMTLFKKYSKQKPGVLIHDQFT